MGQPFKMIQTNFTAGELSPRMYGRVDQQKYYSGAAVFLNMFPWSHGGATRRPGSQYINTTKISSKKSRLIPFVFSITQSYMLELGDFYFRIYRNRSQVISGTPVEVVTPWGQADLAALKFTQSADTLYVSHPNYPPQKITRTSDILWTITPIAFSDGPYLNLNITATTLTPSGVSGSITITASAATFVSTDVGRLIRMQQSGSWSWVKITAYTDSTHVTATVIGANFLASLAVTTWMLGAWSATTGYPSVVTIYQQRTVWGNTLRQPTTLWGSASGDFENMVPSGPTGTVVDANAYTFTLADDQVNAIYWFSPGKVSMLIGTSSAEFNVFGSSSNGVGIAITPTNITVNRETTHGSASTVRAQRIANSVIYVQPSRRTVRSSTYDYRVDGYVSEDISIFSEHITQSGIIDFDYQEEISSSGWMVRADGFLIGFTYDKAQQVTAWHRHALGATLGGNAVVESVGIIKNPTLTGEDIWLIVNRVINGVTARYIEILSTPGNSYDPIANGVNSAWFVDAGISYNGYLVANLTPGAVSGTGVTFTTDQAVFTAGMVGKQIRSGSGRANITGFTDANHVVCDILSANPFVSLSPVASQAWYVGAQNFTGADHLNGESTQVYADSAALQNVTVTAGAFSLNDFYGQVVIGLGYISDIQLMPDEVQAIGTAQGQTKRINIASIFFYQSLGCKFGTNPAKLETLPFRSTSDFMNVATPLFTGVRQCHIPGGYDLMPQVYIRQDQPLPMTILYVTREFVVNGG